jgi:hypothetical protein
VGARANYVVVDDQGWRLSYSHWGAQVVHADLAPGPEAAVRFAERQEPRDPRTGWLDDRWAEGAALVDLSRRHLLFWGSAEILYRPDTRVPYFALLAETWPGWTVRWAYDELADLASYVGVDVDVVRLPELVPDAAEEAAAVTLALPEDLRQSWGLLTVTAAGGPARAWPLGTWYLDHALWVGERLLELLPGPGTDAVEGRAPCWGLHVDAGARTVAWWTSETMRAAATHAPERWPGWTIESWGDDYARHRAACEDAVRTPDVDLAGGLDELVASLDWNRGADPGLEALRVADVLQASGREVEITAPVTAHVQVEPGEADLRRLDAAVAAVRERLLRPSG